MAAQEEFIGGGQKRIQIFEGKAPDLLRRSPWRNAQLLREHPARVPEHSGPRGEKSSPRGGDQKATPVGGSHAAVIVAPTFLAARRGLTLSDGSPRMTAPLGRASVAPAPRR